MKLTMKLKIVLKDITSSCRSLVFICTFCQTEVSGELKCWTNVSAVFGCYISILNFMRVRAQIGQWGDTAGQFRILKMSSMTFG